MLMKNWQLRQRQGQPLEVKERLTESRIRSWYDYWDGGVYVAFSGGKDSVVLLDQVRKLYPGVPAVFVNTGLEYPEILQFVKTISNVTWLKPKMKFSQIIEKYGYPVISKKISMGLDRYRNTKSEQQKKLRLHGGICPSSGKKQYRTISKKWHFLTKAPFSCSERCCDIIKKEPFNRYEKESNKKPMIGTMTEESFIRQLKFLQEGCLAFNGKKPKATPIAFWKNKDIWDYIDKYNISYSKIYDMGEKRTGCMGCLFGVQAEQAPNRFQRMKKNHLKYYDFYINKLRIGEVLDFINVEYS